MALLPTTAQSRCCVVFRSSPSAIGLHLLCPARAVAKYVWGYEEPESDAMREGTRLHRIVQRYMSEGVVPDTSEKAAHAAIKVLPVAAGSVYQADIERVVLLPEHTGFLDWERGTSRHGDLKFTKSVRYQQAKDPVTDPQRILYALDAFERDSELKTLKQSWTITQFDGAKALTLVHKWTHVAVRKQYDAIIKPVHDALATAVEKTTHWQDVPKNQASCDLYPPDGCHMKKQGCRRSLADRIVAITPRKKKAATK